eukprot:Sspe_Gene.16799::Locus_5936_Transcript_1_1_Confidence_1.000_Length_1566::g.16799::m.16799
MVQMPPFQIDVGSDIWGRKHNYKLHFRELPTLDQLRRGCCEVFDPVVQASRPPGYPDIPFTIETIHYFDDSEQRWRPLDDTSQLAERSQLWCFQPESSWHSDAQGVIPPPLSPPRPHRVQQLRSQHPLPTQPPPTPPPPAPLPQSTPPAQKQSVPSPAFMQNVVAIYKELDSGDVGVISWRDVDCALRDAGLEVDGSMLYGPLRNPDAITFPDWKDLTTAFPGVVDALLPLLAHPPKHRAHLFAPACCPPAARPDCTPLRPRKGGSAPQGTPKPPSPSPAADPNEVVARCIADEARRCEASQLRAKDAADQAAREYEHATQAALIHAEAQETAKRAAQRLAEDTETMKNIQKAAEAARLKAEHEQHMLLDKVAMAEARVAASENDLRSAEKVANEAVARYREAQVRAEQATRNAERIKASLPHLLLATANALSNPSPSPHNSPSLRHPDQRISPPRRRDINPSPTSPPPATSPPPPEARPQPESTRKLPHVLQS